MQSSATKSTVRVLTIVSTALAALETIGELATGILGNGPAEDVRKEALTIRAIVDSIQQGLGGTLTPLEVQHLIEQSKADLVAKLDANDQAAAAAVDAKFPT